MTTAPVVVVGFDDSPAAAAALAWAADWARVTGGSVRALHALAPRLVAPPNWCIGDAGRAEHHGRDLDEPSQRERITALFAATAPAPRTTLELTGAPAGERLVAASASADLLVIGTRGRRGAARLLEGSTSHYCLSRARCPVVAVPAG
ncbi:universal stress protein [Auraticoccus monumenti]|uniref:Nucleotide-binding universal stress protein, UspA family n=1 Tax=Auraticoccus monumenti TaxID=675864 RepID=A0A1G6WBS5_9ACTN|nr:universal stress protein [Auraticoccus monumenti]SDD63400.1 Nucleotide-binding universal stress protein, UspA family [Auraticoccus monumenti]